MKGVWIKLKVSNKFYLKAVNLDYKRVFTLNNTFSTINPNIINLNLQIQKLRISSINQFNQILPIPKMDLIHFLSTTK